MNPLRLRLRNVRSFAELDLDLPAGCVAIVGPNGAGKSTAVNAIDWALFGPDGRSFASYLTQGSESTEMEIELVFEHADSIYRVRRGYSSRGQSKSTLDLEQLDDCHPSYDIAARTGDHWLPVTMEGQRATQAHVEAILGLSRETFRASAFLAQGDGAVWTEATASRRKEILAKILGLDRFEKPLQLVRTDRKAAQQQIERLTGTLDRADVELRERPTVDEMLKLARRVVHEIGAARGLFQTQLEDQVEEISALERQAAGRAAAEAAAAQAEAALRPLEERAQKAQEAAAAITEAELQLEALAPAGAAVDAQNAVDLATARLTDHRAAVETRERTISETAAKTAQRDAILAQARAKGAEAAHLDGHEDRLAHKADAHCPTCEQPLGLEAKAATLANLRARATVAADDAQALAEQAAAVEIPVVPAEPEPPLEAQQALTDARARLQAAQADALTRERLAGQVQLLRESVAAAPAENEVAAARTRRDAAASHLASLPAPDPAALAAGRTAALTLQAQLEEAQRQAETATADEARASAKAERLDALAQQTAEDRGEREGWLTRVDRLLILERAFGRDGIPALIVQGAAIPAIEAEAGRILGELGTSYRVELRTEKMLAGGGMADALDVVVLTEKGERNYESFSGGERTRINLALRIALARLLASRRGAESKLLAIDEPDGLDEAGMAALVRVLEGMNGTFERTFLISHVPDLRAAFDTTITVVKGDDGLSRIASSGGAG